MTTSIKIHPLLDLRAGFASAQGRRARNEDWGGLWLGDQAQRARHGAVAVLADGIGGAKAGDVAAELAVRGFVDGYLGQSETLGVRRAAAVALDSVNRWIHAQGRSDPALEAMGSTLAALILRGRQVHWLSVGDTRIYRLRAGRLACLTLDHVSPRAGLSHVLLRSVGGEEGVRADFAVEAARADDRYLLATDGIHGTLDDRQIARILGAAATPDAAADDLVAAALEAGSMDNASAIAVEILTLPEADTTELELAIAALPILEPPRPGERIDGYTIGPLLSDGRYSRLFRSVDESDGRPVVLKFPKPRVAEDASFRLAFLRETWVAARVRSPWVGEVIEPPPERRTRLYSVMPHYEGETLEHRLARLPAVSLGEGIPIAVKLAKAVAALHRAGVVHRDVKPDNVILEPGGGLKLIDLGVAHLPNLPDFAVADIPGTASYMAPEQFAGSPGTERSDLFALGVTIYRLFAGGAYPYGEIEAFSHPRFGRPQPLVRHRPDLAPWLDDLLARALAADPGQRTSDALELAFDLEQGQSRSRPPSPRRRSLYERNPVRVWQGIAAALFLALLAALKLR
ncbi:MAG TPA: bifunctional protein-serine/threonine kinase/phosphatase [Aliidongia sp.]|uniref:bifunctional protein-serine/threonine kinase/phosphatase n=1 Tax=Aliidongia sp. TaxID=1914230 RepID=UPI002DDC9109|nr:bifunctional protein-serine/threonine kinase/phosphatase [Aliidongia sp.]HEV2676510.1 bifunctional protein-serine/threonine kinase/phosphatase [Aliidongia sp.]